MANNQNQKANGTTTEQVTEQQQVQQAPVQTAETPQQANPAAVTEQKGGFGEFCKRHWKGLVAAITGTGAAVTSAVVAYKKGKQAGMMAIPPQTVEPEDYSLNPNE